MIDTPANRRTDQLLAEAEAHLDRIEEVLATITDHGDRAAPPPPPRPMPVLPDPVVPDVRWTLARVNPTSPFLWLRRVLWTRRHDIATVVGPEGLILAFAAVAFLIARAIS